MKLQTKIQLPLILLIAVVVGTNSYISYNSSAKALRETLIESMAGEAKGLARAISEKVVTVIGDTVRIAQRPDVINFYDENISDKAVGETFSKLLQDVVKDYSGFDRVAILDTKGIIVSSSAPTSIGQNFSDREYVKASLQGQTFLSQPMLSRVSGAGVVISSTPVKRGNEIVGILYCSIPLDMLNKASVQPIKIGKEGHAYVLTASGLAAIHPNKDWLFNETLSSLPILKEFASTTTDGPKEFINAAGKHVISYHAKDKLSGLTAVVQAEYDDVFSGLTDIRNGALIVAGISILAAALLFFILLRPLLRAINAGVAFAQRVAVGDLSSTLDITRKDELGQLAEALREIPASLKRVVAEYQKLEKNIEVGNLDAQGDAESFSGEFGSLIQGTNSILKRFLMVTESIPSPVIMTDKELKIRYMNDVARQISSNDYKGKTCDNLFRFENFGTSDCAATYALQRREAKTMETKAAPKGTDMEVRYTVIPMLDAQGQVVSILQLFIDLTDIKKKQYLIIDVANTALGIADRVAAASEELSAQVDQINNGVEIQRDRVGSTVAAMEEMNSTVMEVARNSGQASEQAEATRNKASEGEKLVGKVISAIKEVNSVALELQGNMQDLGKQAEAIGNIMNVISDIADQTNLLALNAAIEAARAGDAGRGFAVVADEVRKLAEKTMTATTEVGSSIRAIQASATANIQRVGEASKSVAVATELAGTSGVALGEIVSLASTNSAFITSIATAAEQQSATSEEINHSIEEINKIADETAESMSESATAVRDLSQTALELKNTLEKLHT